MDARLFVLSGPVIHLSIIAIVVVVFFECRSYPNRDLIFPKSRFVPHHHRLSPRPYSFRMWVSSHHFFRATYHNPSQCDCFPSYPASLSFSLTLPTPTAKISGGERKREREKERGGKIIAAPHAAAAPHTADTPSTKYPESQRPTPQSWPRAPPHRAPSAPRRAATAPPAPPRRSSKRRRASASPSARP